MTWQELLRWVEDPQRSLPELRNAGTGLQAHGMPPIPPQRNRVQVRALLRRFIREQPDMNAQSPWQPGCRPARPAQPARPARPTPANQTRSVPWGQLAYWAILFTLGLLLAVAVVGVITGGILAVRWAWVASRPDLIVDYVWRPRVVERVVTPVPAQEAIADFWKEVDFHPTGDRQDIVNVDHGGKQRVTIAWFYAALGDNPPAEGCTAVVLTDSQGGKVTMRGAFRTWEWVAAGKPSKADVQKLVSDWVKVLEAEPRGACAKKGAYQVSWQDPSLAP